MPKLPPNYIEITVTLPICLHLDGRTFIMPFKQNTSAEIRTNNVFNNQSTHLGYATNCEVISDSFSHFRFTEITVKFPVFEQPPIPENQIQDKYANTFFIILNNFLNCVRIALKRYALKEYHSYTEFLGPVNVKSYYTSGAIGMGISINFGGLSAALPIRSEQEHKVTQQLLTNGYPLDEIFLADSKRELHYSNYIHSILNAVIALEIKISELISTIATKKEINKEAIENFIKDVGLTGNIKTTLKLLLEPNQLPDDEILGKCKTAITLRNAIMHKGRRDLPIDDISGLVNAIESMIFKCTAILS